MRAFLAISCSAALSSAAGLPRPSAPHHLPCLNGLCAENNSLSLLQLSAKVGGGAVGEAGFDVVGQGDRVRRHLACSPLDNHGSFFSVALKVGTPPQRFDVVADTGSNSVIIPSCLCQRSGSCPADGRCFDSSKGSSTFAIAKKNIPVLDIEFGSGSIAAVIGSDVVRVGTARALMEDALLLMMEQKLAIDGQIQGILGLGPLQAEYTENQHMNELSAWDLPPVDDRALSHHQEVTGFLRQAHVSRFSICFNDGLSPGVLRLNTRKQENLLPSVGSTHWGLEFNGMSVGPPTSDSHNVLFCGGDKHEGACAAVLDSGTTLMVGPEDQVRLLFAGLCDNWPRCLEAATVGPLRGQPREEVFQRMLLGCEDWLRDEQGSGLAELPPIHLHLGGSQGHAPLEMSGWAYVFESAREEAAVHAKLLGSLGISQEGEESALGTSNKYVCVPAFGVSEVPRSADGGGSDSGPVWIIGTPLFYEYIVHFDLATRPPSIAFGAELCGSCKTKVPASVDDDGLLEEDGSGGQQHAPLLIEEAARSKRGGEALRQPRFISGPVRVGRHTRRRPM